mgnify:CR=1 FL=1
MSEDKKSDKSNQIEAEIKETTVETSMVNDDNPQDKERLQKKKGLVHTIFKWIARIFFTLFLLVVLLIVLVYLPPVQRFAINKASQWLSEETGMDVSVRDFSLGFPLDLEMGGVLAVQDGDTVVNADNLTVSIQFLPLFSGKVVVDNVELNDLNLNTKNLIDAFTIKGRIGTLSLNADDIDLSEEYGTINKVRLKNTELFLALADSVPEDTTVSEPSKWKFNLEDIQTDNVKLTLLLAPQADSTSLSVNIDHGDFVGKINMETSNYDFSRICLKNSSVAYSMGMDMDVNVDFGKLGLVANLDMGKGRYRLNALQMDEPDIALNSGTDTHVGVKAESLHLDGDINLEAALFKFANITLNEADILFAQKPDMNLNVNSEKITLDGLLDMNTSIYDFMNINLDNSSVEMVQGKDMKLDVDMPMASLNGRLNMLTGVYDFTDISLYKPQIAMAQGKDMELDVNMERVGLNASFDTDKSAFNIAGVNLLDTKVKMKQGRDMNLDLAMKKASLDGKLNLNNSQFDFKAIRLDNTSLAMKQGNELDIELSMQKTGLDANLDLNRSVYNLKSLTMDNSKLKMKQGADMSLDVDMANASLNTSVNLEKANFIFDDLRMENANIDMSTKEGMAVHADIARGAVNGKLDLNRGDYAFSNIALTNADVRYDADNNLPQKGFDASHLAFDNMNANISNLSYKANGEMTAEIAHFSGMERSGLNLKAASGSFAMNEKQLKLNDFNVQTPNSNLSLDYAMDMNAFDTPTRGNKPGQFNVNLDGRIAKKDMALFANEFYPEFEKQWPAKDIYLKAVAKGNMQKLDVKNFEARMNGIMDVKGSLQAKNLTSENMALNTKFNAKINDMSFVKGFLPSDLKDEYDIPNSIDLVADARYDNSGVYAVANGRIGDTMVNIDGKVGLDSEDYDFIADLSNFNLRDFMPKANRVKMTGYVAAKGHGFDLFAPTTTCNANLDVSHLVYEEYELENINATIALFRGDIDASLSVNDPNLRTYMAINGTVGKDNVDAKATVELPHADLGALGLYDGVLKMQTAGEFSLSTDMNHVYRATADLDSLYTVIDNDTLNTPSLALFAETNNDSTQVKVNSGDMFLDFFSPQNLFDLAEKYQKTGELAVRFAKERNLNLNLLKRHLPEASLKAKIGTDNFISHILKINGISFDKVNADFSTDSIRGVYGMAYIDKLIADSILVDAVDFNLRQDTTNLAFKTSVVLPDQPKFDGFTAKLDGHVKIDEAKVTITHVDQKGKTGLNLGIIAEITDTALIGRLIPEKPILAYMKFKVNEDNYLTLDTLNRLFANVNLNSLEDSCAIDIYANPQFEGQDIHANAYAIDLSKVSALMPNMNPVKGHLNLFATYRKEGEQTKIRANSLFNNMVYDGTPVGNLGASVTYIPVDSTLHSIDARIQHENNSVLSVKGTYNAIDGPQNGVDAIVNFNDFPLSITAPFIPNQIVRMGGTLGGSLAVTGPTDKLNISGELLPDSMVAVSDIYSLKLEFENKPISFANKKITFNNHKIYGYGDVPLTLAGQVDMENMDDMGLNLRLYGKGFNLINAPRTKRSVAFGNMYGDFFAGVRGTMNNMRIRGMVNVLPTTDMTYVMTNTPLSIDYRLSDIVTFVDFTQPPLDVAEREKPSFSGVDMLLNLNIQNGAKFHCEFSADKQSYINVEGEGALEMTYTPQGTLSLLGRYTINEGDMKYTLPIIPLKDFKITPGSYIEFTGNPSNPSLHFSANEDMTSTVSDNSGSRSVKFKTGLDVQGTLEQMGLLFTIDAPEDMIVKNELASMSVEERNKLAVAMLCTGMYMSTTNQSGMDANNALNNFLEKEINNIAGKALNTMVDVNMGMEQRTRDDGTTRTDYSFKFSRRFFNNRLNVIIGGKVSTDGDGSERESGAYIDDVSLEWRLDQGGNRYVKLFHERNYENLFEGELISNGISYIFRKKMDKFSDIWRSIQFIKNRNNQQ